ncbi:hypothetical protein PG985_003190 [Apiospora marii]|uniref:uncharacterized protein n=1 Tax=Apiospora marii TaxID=335849 RepID=UPI0031300AF0
MRRSGIASLSRLLVPELTSENMFVDCLRRDGYGLLSTRGGLRCWLVLWESNPVLVWLVALVVESDREGTTRREVREDDHNVLEAPIYTATRKDSDGCRGIPISGNEDVEQHEKAGEDEVHQALADNPLDEGRLAGMLLVLLLSFAMTATLFIVIAAVTEQLPPAHGAANFHVVHIPVLGNAQQLRHDRLWDQLEHVPEHHKKRDSSEGSAQTGIAIIGATRQQHHAVGEGKRNGGRPEKPHQDLICWPSPVAAIFVSIAVSRRAEGSGYHGWMEMACRCTLF